MKKDFAAPVLVLTAICLLVTAVLAFTNFLTAPKIAADRQARANEMLKEVLPEADGFSELPLEGLPSSIMQANEATNGAGFVFTVVATGYGGEIKIMCGLSGEGEIVLCKTMEHSETQGIGSKVADESFTSGLTGLSDSTDGISAVSGATITSKAYLGAIADVFEAFESVKA